MGQEETFSFQLKQVRISIEGAGFVFFFLSSFLFLSFLSSVSIAALYSALKSQQYFSPERCHQANSHCQLLDTTTRDVKSSPVPTPNTEREGNHPTPFLLAEAGRVTVPQEESGCFPQTEAGYVTSLRSATRRAEPHARSSGPFAWDTANAVSLRYGFHSFPPWGTATSLGSGESSHGTE